MLAMRRSHMNVCGRALLSPMWPRSWRATPLQRASRASRLRLPVASTATNGNGGGRSLEPYIIRDRIVVLTAQWDPREHDAEEYAALERQLLRRGAHSVDLLCHQGAHGPPVVRATVTCAAGDASVADALAALILAETAATGVRQSEELLHALPVTRVRVGEVGVHVSVKGGEVFKASPDWQDCERAALAAVGAAPAVRGGATEAERAGPVSAEDVATAALLGLRQGLEDGSIDLGMQFLC